MCTAVSHRAIDTAVTPNGDSSTMTSRSQRNVLILIPAYNAGDYLPDLLPQLKALVPPDDLLVVNDGSVDRTLAVLNEHKVNYISFSRNRGKGAALKAGFDYAMGQGYRSVLTLDADLQHSPEDIPRFLSVDDGHHLILGTRRPRLGVMPLSRWISNNLTSIIVSVFSAERIRDSQSGFRLIPVELLRAVPLTAVDFDLESELLFKAGAMGYPVVELPIATVYGHAGSHIRHFGDTFRFVGQIWKRFWI